MFSYHFQNIFLAYPMRDSILDVMNAFYNVVPRKVSICHSDRLDLNFTKDEFFNTLTSMKSGKYLGIDQCSTL